jgi:hypothetical protein
MVEARERDMRDQTSRARPSTQQREPAGTARLPPASHCLDAGEWRIESARDKAAQRLACTGFALAVASERAVTGPLLVDLHPSQHLSQTCGSVLSSRFPRPKCP